MADKKGKVNAKLLKTIQIAAREESVLKLEDVAPAFLAYWLGLLSVTADTQPAILLSVILPCVAALMGSTAVQVRNKIKREVCVFAHHQL